MTKPKESAEEIVNLIISNTASQYSEEWKPDIVYTKEELIEIVQSFQDQCVREACKAQREICESEFKKSLHSSSQDESILCIINAPEPL